jgi:hypothetical protein
MLAHMPILALIQVIGAPDLDQRGMVTSGAPSTPMTNPSTATPFIPLEIIRDRVFADPKNAARIRKDYGLAPELCGAELERALLTSFDQQERDVTTDQPGAKEVFEAAVRALGSNMRPWVAFHRAEPTIREALANYHSAVVSVTDQPHERLKKALGGQTAGRDARAMLDWASLLTQHPDYGALLQRLRRHFRERAAVAGMALRESDLTALVAAALGSPSPELMQMFRDARLKAPGMGPTLASEFLRNLGWSGFKPDRHIKRLLEYWFGLDHPAIKAHAEAMARLIGSTHRDLVCFFFFSALGATKSPPSLPLNQVDQLVWLFGSVAQRKPRAPHRH